MTQDGVVLRLTAVARDGWERPERPRARATADDAVSGQGAPDGVTLAVETEQRFGIVVRAADMVQVRSIREWLTLMGVRVSGRRPLRRLPR